MDFNGRPIAKEGDFPFKEKLFALMGIGVSATGDVWIADGAGDQLLHFPGGRIKDGRIVKPEGLRSPFDIVIDSQNRVWVSNSQSDTVVRFPMDDPTKVETFRAGLAVRALALDLEGERVGGKQHVSGLSHAEGPRWRVYYGAISDHGRCRVEVSKTYRRDQYDPPGRHPTGAKGFRA